ncbi:MAG: site-2 protease family protein [Dehalococcoidia bacterium]|nr:site-2 protease family protein [Dehalococcoidia bacterium]
MGASLRLGRILGIEIRLHYSWFVIFAIITYFVFAYFHEEYTALLSMAAGLAASLLFFSSVVAHELSHSMVAVKNGIPVKSITLFILGGVASITREPERPKSEIVMAIAGPLCSLLIGSVFAAIWVASGGLNEDANRFHDLLFILAQVNIIVLALFNLLPGFPLDGGRLLRAVLWNRTRDYLKATRIASIGGQVIGWTLVGLGAIVVVLYFRVNEPPLDVDILDGVWLAMVGLFLSSIAASSYRQAAWREVMKGIVASSVMTSEFVAIPPGMSLMQLVRDYVQSRGYRSFVVAVDGKFQGMVNLENIRRIPEKRWDMTTADSVMTPADKVVTATLEEDGVSIAEKMEEHKLDGIPVVREGMVVGLVTRNSLAHGMQVRAQFRTK